MLAKSISMVTLGKKLEKKSCEKVTLAVKKKWATICVPTLQSLYQGSLNAEVMGYLFLVSQSLRSNCSLPVARVAVSIEFVSRVDFILSLAIVICNAFASLGTSRPDKPKQLMFKKSDDECLPQFHVLFRARAFSRVYNDKISTI